MDKRDLIGTVGFFLLSVVFGIIVLPFMIAREIYQYIKYLKPCKIGFEWWDAIRYGIFICVGSMIHWCVLEQIFDKVPWYFII